MSVKRLITYYAIGFLGWGLVYHSLNSEPPKNEPKYFDPISVYGFEKNSSDLSVPQVSGLEGKLLTKNNFD